MNRDVKITKQQRTIKRQTGKASVPRHRKDWLKAMGAFKWVPAFCWQRLVRKATPRPFHLIIAIADHFEPYISRGGVKNVVPRSEQILRVQGWCQRYPQVFDCWRDGSSSPFKHSYFYAAEHYDAEIIDILAQHCHLGWGEIEVHLHHGISSPDTAENTRCSLVAFRDRLLKHGCLCHLEDSRDPRYGFVHGNWALANSAGGRFCGVDEEMQILADTGCYADFTLPSAPSVAQIGKINSLYECEAPINVRSAHRRGDDLACGRTPTRFPLILQGPLALGFHRTKYGILPVLENSAISAVNPPSTHRLKSWINTRISVRGRPDWVFVKLHCHGMDPRDTPTLLGRPMEEFLRHLAGLEGQGKCRVHFVTVREMTNIVLAACEGRSGDPSEFRDHRLRLFHANP
jgi:hypothetical protein